MLSELMADMVVAAHIGYFLFVVGGFLAILVGWRRGWEWIRNPWFRICHLAAVYIVIAEDVFQFECPLNTMEWNLRSSNVTPAEASSGVSFILNQLLRHTIPGEVLHVIYWSLGILLLLLLIAVPPSRRALRTDR